MISSIRYSLLVTAAVVLAACASAPVHYYTLLAPPQGRDVMPAANFLIDVLPVGIPAQVDQPQLVVRQGEDTIAMLDDERWAAPLSDELRAALSAELVQRFGTQDVAGMARAMRKPVLRVKVAVRRFDSVPGQYALIDADWSLDLAGDPGNTRLFCHSELRESVGAGYTGLVRGHQQAVAALAAQIAQTARGWVLSRAATCPKQ